MSLIKILFPFAFVSVLICSQGCDVNENTDKTDPDIIDVSSFTSENFPKVDGSTSTHPLMIVAACEILDVEYMWYDAFDGTKRVSPSYQDTSKEADYIRHIIHYGTHQSYVNLITDSVDIILTAREPSEDELALAISLSVNLISVPIALDALVFIINTSNSLNDLSSDHIIGIYTGLITNWNEIGGTNAAILPYRRNRNSGSQELMEKLVMQGRQMLNAPEMEFSSMMPMIYTIENTPDAIGYTVYFYNTTMVPRTQVKMISINNIYPDPQSIGSRKYAYTSPVFAVIRQGTDINSTTFLLYKWLQTQAGQVVVAKSGYVPFTK